MRTARVLAVAVALVALAGCGSSGGSSGGSKDTSSPPTSGSTGTPPTSKADDSATMTFTGAFSGSVAVNLCTGAIASIKVTVDGDSSSYNGSISATQMGFVGPDAADYSLKEGDAKPTVSADQNTFSVDHATLVDLISHKSIVVNGSVTCP